MATSISLPKVHSLTSIRGHLQINHVSMIDFDISVVSL